MNRREMFANLASICAVLRLKGFSPEVRLRGTEGGKSCLVRKFVLPMYPPLARQVGIEGKVVVLANLSPDGLVASVTIVSGHSLLLGHVEDCLKNWEFEAVGDQVKQAKLEFNFVLKGDRVERILSYRVSGKMPGYFEIETNPSTNVYSSGN